MKRSDITTLSVLKACDKFHKKSKKLMAIETLINEYSLPKKIIYRAMERDCKNGLIEYGTSLGTAWVTETGYKFLNS